MPHTPSRRDVLKTGAAAGLALLAGTEAFAAAPESIPIVDTHVHLWDFKQPFRPVWLKEAPLLNKSFDIAEYQKATAGLNIDKMVYMEVDLAPKDQVAEAEYVKNLCAKKQAKFVAGVVSCRPGLPGFEAYVRKFDGSPYIKGVRQILHVPTTPKGYGLKPKFVKDIQLLGDLGLTFDICIRPEELLDAAKLVDQCPGTRFVLDHCGNGIAGNPNQKQWERDMKTLAERPNIICKVSGVVRSIRPGKDPVKELEPLVWGTVKAFGWDRVMFAGDWPVCLFGAPYKVWAQTLMKIVAKESKENQLKLFHDNAVEFYSLAK